MSRLDDLKWMREVVRGSIEDTPPPQRAPLVAQLRAVVAEMDEIGETPAGERNGLIDFQEALAERQRTGSKAPRSASR